MWELTRSELRSSLAPLPAASDELFRFFGAWHLFLHAHTALRTDPAARRALPTFDLVTRAILSYCALNRETRHFLLAREGSGLTAWLGRFGLGSVLARALSLSLRLAHPLLPEGAADATPLLLRALELGNLLFDLAAICLDMRVEFIGLRGLAALRLWLRRQPLHARRMMPFETSELRSRSKAPFLEWVITRYCWVEHESEYDGKGFERSTMPWDFVLSHYGVALRALRVLYGDSVFASLPHWAVDDIVALDAAPGATP